MPYLVCLNVGREHWALAGKRESWQRRNDRSETERIGHPEQTWVGQPSRQFIYNVCDHAACNQEVGANHVHHKTAYCQKCLHEAGKNHVCDATRFCYDHGTDEAVDHAQREASAAGGTVQRLEEGRAKGMIDLAQKLAAQDALRPDLTIEEAAHVLWLVTSFDAFDVLYSARGLSVDETVEVLTTTAERTLYR
jgi:hypothetical protein